MKKLLFILLILFVSCEKDNSNDTFCWTCTQTTIISFIDYSTGYPVTNPDIDITTQLITICDANMDSIKTFRLMSALLYEDYFNVNFRNNLHQEVLKLIIPQSPEDMKKLYEVIEEKDGPINVSLFFGSVIPIVNLIEKNTLM